MPSLILPTQCRVSAEYGRQNKALWGDEGHKGVDFACPENTPIRASAGGVAVVGENPLSGKFVGVKHAGGWYTGYCHLNTALVNPGERVRMGRVVGLSGSTGHSTGFHLHLTLRNPKGERVKPAFVATDFVDVGPEDVELFAVLKEAKAKGIVKGVDGAFNPTAPITRGDALLLVMRRDGLGGLQGVGS